MHTMFVLGIISTFALICVSNSVADSELLKFREEFDDMKVEVNRLNYVNAKLTEELSERKESEKRLLSRLEKLEDALQALTEAAHANHRRQAISEVGFLATVTADERNLHLDQTILFDTVITNIGNGYNNGDGTFHCPVSGTYMFNFNVMALDTEYVEASLIVNGNHLINALSDQKGTSVTWDQGATAAILQLNAGDVVRVGIQWPDTANNAVHGNRFTTFSGYLLSQLQ